MSDQKINKIAEDTAVILNILERIVPLVDGHEAKINKTEGSLSTMRLIVISLLLPISALVVRVFW